jgi:hypothetical protein
VIPPLVELVLGYYRDPLAYGHLADGSFPLPLGFSKQLAALGHAISPQQIDETARIIDATPAELEDAVRFFSRHVLLHPTADYYRSLGLSPRAPLALVRNHYRILIKLFHPDKVPNATASDLSCSRRLNAAYEVLSDPSRRAGYDRQRRASRRKTRLSDPRDFYRPRQVALAQSNGGWRLALRRHREGRWSLILGMVGLFSVLAIGGGIWLAKPQPSLRASASIESALEPARPSYLAPPTDDSVTASFHPASLPALGSSADALSNLSAAHGDLSKDDVAEIGQRLAQELQVASRRGDMRALADLFARPRASDPYVLLGLPSGGNTELSAEDNSVWLTLDAMRWRWAQGGLIIGIGRMKVSRPMKPAEQRDGRVELTLVPTESRYLIRRARFEEDRSP